jgi:polar amino acid transport system substrate-binding protein
MTLSQRGIPISVFGYESDMLDAIASGEVAAAAVTPTSAGWWNLSHPDTPVTILPPDESQPDLVWNVAIGMRHPDDALRDAINAAIQKLREDGTVARIYASYGVTLQSPKQ